MVLLTQDASVPARISLYLCINRIWLRLSCGRGDVQCRRWYLCRNAARELAISQSQPVASTLMQATSAWASVIVHKMRVRLHDQDLGRGGM